MNPHRPALGIALLIATLHTAQAAPDFETYATLQSLTYSEIAPIKQTIDGLEGDPIDSGEFAFTHNQLEVGQRWKGFEVAAFWRYDYYLQFNDDTAELFYRDKNDLPVRQGKNYDLYLRANHLRSSGFGIGYRHHFTPTLSVRGRVNYLAASEMQDGVIRGNATTMERTYSGNLKLDYSYSEDLLLDRPKESVRGRGYSADFDIDWAVTDRLNLYVHGRDVHSRISWDNLTYTTGNATTDRARYRDDGSLSFRPAATTFDGYRNHVQKLPARYQLGGSYQLTDFWSLGGEVFTYDGHAFPSAELGMHFNNFTVRANYDIEAEALGAGIEHRYFQFMLRTDNLDWEEAKFLHLQLTARVQF